MLDCVHGAELLDWFITEEKGVAFPVPINLKLPKESLLEVKEEKLLQFLVIHVELNFLLDDDAVPLNLIEIMGRLTVLDLHLFGKEDITARLNDIPGFDQTCFFFDALLLLIFLCLA